MPPRRQYRCSVCGGQGHNKRTCIARKIDEAEGLGGAVRDEVKDRIVDYICEHIEDEAMCQAIEIGADVACPGLGVTIKFGRGVWRVMRG